MDARAWPALMYRAGATGVAGEDFDITNVQDGLFEGFLIERVSFRILVFMTGTHWHIIQGNETYTHRPLICTRWRRLSCLKLLQCGTSQNDGCGS